MDVRARIAWIGRDRPSTRSGVAAAALTVGLAHRGGVSAAVGGAGGLAGHRLPAGGPVRVGGVGPAPRAPHLTGQRCRVQLLPHPTGRAASRSPTAATGWRWRRSCSWPRWSAPWRRSRAAGPPTRSGGSRRPTWRRRWPASSCPATERERRSAATARRIAQALPASSAAIELREVPAGMRQLALPLHDPLGAGSRRWLRAPRIAARHPRTAARADRAHARGADRHRARTGRDPGRGGGERSAAPQRRAEDGAPAGGLPRPPHAGDRDRHRRPCARLGLAPGAGASGAQPSGGRGGRSGCRR